MTTVTIFHSPLDHPGKYVARVFEIHAGSSEPVPAAEPLCVVDTLEGARAAIPPGLYPIARSPEDHESVVETWL